jgi:hypothetical protein
MPIEVRELVIRARVEETQTETGRSARIGQPEYRLNEGELDAIVAQCVDKVVEALRKQKER